MTITNGYTTLTAIKAKGALGFGDSNDYDTMLEQIIEAVSRKIDLRCRRVFYKGTQTRYYTPDNPALLMTHDIVEAASFELYADNDGDGVFETQWQSTDYVLEPFDAETDGVPYTMVRRATSGVWAFPNVTKGVKIVAKFGYPNLPAPIVSACLLQSERLFKRYATPLGSESLSAFGTTTLQMPALDPDVEDLIAPYRRLV